MITQRNKVIYLRAFPAILLPGAAPTLVFARLLQTPRCRSQCTVQSTAPVYAIASTNKPNTMRYQAKMVKSCVEM